MGCTVFPNFAKRPFLEHSRYFLWASFFYKPFFAGWPGPNLGFYVDTRSIQTVSIVEQHSDLLAFFALDSHWLETPGAHHLSQASGIIFIGFHQLCFHHGMGMTGLEADNMQPGVTEAMKEPMGERSGFKPDSDITYFKRLKNRYLLRQAQWGQHVHA